MADNLLTRKYGGVPGWAIGGGALVAGLAFFYFRRQSSSSSSSTGTPTGGSLVNNPAASAIPYVPSVTVTGLPVGATTPSSLGPSPSAPVSAGNATITGNPAGVFAQPTTKSALITTLPKGTTVQSSGAPVQGENYGGVSYWVPVNYGGLTGYVAGALIQLGPGSSGGGQGGWGQAGSSNAVAMMGWTAGWTPVVSGPGQRGGSGDGFGGPPGSSPTRAASRRARVGIPVRRRAFSGR
jgi:Bacterial SH3 domain